MFGALTVASIPVALSTWPGGNGTKGKGREIADYDAPVVSCWNPNDGFEFPDYEPKTTTPAGMLIQFTVFS